MIIMKIIVMFACDLLNLQWKGKMHIQIEKVK